MPIIQTYAVLAEGVGRKDYSLMVEHTVEPIIRSYQESYSEWEAITVLATSDFTRDIAIPTGYVAILHDFFATVSVSTLLGLTVYAVSDAEAGIVISKTNYGSVVAHIPKGFPFFEIVRFTVHNYSDVDLDVNIGAGGIYTSETQYYLEVRLQP